MKHLFYQLLIFYFGGDDAISITVPRIFRQTQLNPECVTKLRAEHDTILSPDTSVLLQKGFEKSPISETCCSTLWESSKRLFA